MRARAECFAFCCKQNKLLQRRFLDFVVELIVEKYKKERALRYAPLTLLDLNFSYDEIDVCEILRFCAQVGKGENAIWRSDVYNSV